MEQTIGNREARSYLFRLFDEVWSVEPLNFMESIKNNELLTPELDARLP